MKTGAFLAIGATIAAAALFAACGGDDDSSSDTDGGSSSSNITTQRGLAVAALFDTSNTGGDAQSNLPAAAPGAGGAETADDLAQTGVSQSELAAPQQLADGTLGITVSGFGLASADPDSAVIDFYLYRYGGGVTPVPEPIEPDIKPTFAAGEVEPITEADVQPIIDALTGAGVAADDIEFLGQTYYDPYSASATLRATVNNIDIVDSAVQAGTDAGNAIGDISVNPSVTYTLQDCDALEVAALDAAVTDARERGQKLATALDVTLGEIVGASDYSYSPSGVPCSGGYPYPIYYDAISARGSSGSAGAVQVASQISVTFAMQ
jgi:uncharacterized protein YggE